MRIDLHEQYLAALRDSRTSLALGTRVIVKTRAGRQEGVIVALPPSDPEAANGVWNLFVIRLRGGSVIHVGREALDVCT